MNTDRQTQLHQQVIRLLSRQSMKPLRLVCGQLPLPRHVAEALARILANDAPANLIETVMPNYLDDPEVTLALEQTFVAGACCALAARDGEAAYRQAYRAMLRATRAALEAQRVGEIAQAAEKRRQVLARLRARVAQQQQAEGQSGQGRASRSYIRMIIIKISPVRYRTG